MNEKKSNIKSHVNPGRPLAIWIESELEYRKGDFPLKGKELKEIIVNIKVFELAINDQDKYINWVKDNPRIAKNLDKLIE